MRIDRAVFDSALKPNKFRAPVLIALVFFLGTTPRSVLADEPDSRAAVDFFEKSVRPVLSESCQKCHGPRKQSSELRLDSREAILKGGSLGPAIVPGKPDESLLVQAVAHSHDVLKMPPKGKLPDPAVAALRRWVEMGAPWGDFSTSATAAAVNSATDSRAGHWAFAPLRKVVIPTVKNRAWVRSPVDVYVLARLEQEGIAPSAAADRRTLIRRATFDLLGLPPTAAEIDAFAADPAPDAFARVVDRLLASPQYGERWGRHWLDVARYADTKGYVFTEERKYPFAYTYRDYVIRSFNADLPYDQFLLQQVAADQLDLKGDPGPLAAMGFLTVGRRFLKDKNEIIDDRIDVIGRGLLGLTIGCARCHDHKYDPIPSADYYSLYGVFASSVEPAEKDLPPISLAGAGDAETKKIKPKPVPEPGKSKPRKNGKKKDDGKEESVGPFPPRAMVLWDAPTPVDPHIFIRGNPGRPGQAVPRQFLRVLAGPERKPFAKGSGRLELARAIVDPANPLTARVLVNRVWQWHFGQALVTTPSDFGLRSDPPSHPDLLDNLARSFVTSGWSIKALHRRIMLSSTYQQSSDLRPDCLERDPQNRLLWRYNRQRLDFEAMRDSVLAVAGTLDSTMGGPSVELQEPPLPTRRTVYGFIDRQNLDAVFRTFDFAVPDATSPKRFVTTVPQQALFLMNSPFVQQQASKLAEAVAQEAGSSSSSSPGENQIYRLYRRVLGRSPEASELARGAAFLNRHEPSQDALSTLAQLAQVLIITNEFLFVD